MNLTEAAKVLNVPLDVDADRLDATLATLNAELLKKIDSATSDHSREKYRTTLAQVHAAGELFKLASAVYRADPAASASSPETSAPFPRPAAPASPASPPPSPPPPIAAPAPKITAPPASPKRDSGRRSPALIIALLLLVGGAGVAVVLMKNRPAASVPEASAASATAELATRLESARARWARLEAELAASEKALSEIEALAPEPPVGGDSPDAAERRARRRAQEAFIAWCRPFLAGHPAKVELEKFTLLVTALAPLEAEQSEATLGPLLNQAEKELDAQKSRLLTLGRTLSIESDPAGLPFILNDAYGRSVEGTTPARVESPWGRTRLSIVSPGETWPDWKREFTLDRDQPDEAGAWKAVFALAPVRLESTPPGLAYELSRPDGKNAPLTGTTPADLADQATGSALLRVSRPGWPDQIRMIEIGASTNVFAVEFVPGALDIRSEPAGATVSRDGLPLGSTPLILPDQATGEHVYRLTLSDHEPLTLRTRVEPGETTVEQLTLKPVIRPQTGQPYTVPDLGMVLIPVSAGSFSMGTSSLEAGYNTDEEQHTVVLTEDFWIGRFEVTRAEWRAVMEPEAGKADDDLLPVSEVPWADAMAFCQKLTAREHAAERLPGTLEYTLPTEAQWEYACRAGTRGQYGGDGVLEDMGWYQLNSGGGPRPVGQKRANAWGLHDMHGNVWEWCADWFQYYPVTLVIDPAGPPAGAGKIGRGGGWGSAASTCRSASRMSFAPTDHLGFRVVLGRIREAAPPRPETE